MTWKLILEAAAKVFLQLFGLVSPQIREELNSFVKGLYVKAQATTSPWDDHAIEVLALILGIDLTAK